MLKLREILPLARAQGLSAVNFTDLSPLAEDVKRLQLWQDNGYAADLAYMKRDPQKFGDLQSVLKSARSILSFRVNYPAFKYQSCPPGFGRIASYAWGRDYHLVLLERMKNFVEEVSRNLGQKISFRIFSDAVPILERALALRAGGGFIGKNSMLIVPGAGSYFFIAELLWDLEIEDDSVRPKRAGCSTCARCISACPTGAIVGDRIVDAGKCISYLTIEKKGILNNEEAVKIGDWVFGCDICQDVCPFNHAPKKSASRDVLPEFLGEGLIDLNYVFSFSNDQDFKMAFRDRPLLRAKREGLIRNAVHVAANTGARACLPALERLATHDSSAVVKQAAEAALERMA